MDFGGMESNDVLVLKRKFVVVHREIDHIKVKIHKKKGFIFFKSHVYTEQELLNSEHHHRIYAVTAKIGDDATHWYKAGKLSGHGKNTYYNLKSQVETELHRVNLEIELREPTWWENVRGAFEGFRRIVAANMPELVLTMIELVANKFALPIPLRKILRLPYLENNMIAYD